jgi:hypothetical protein
LQLAVAVLLAIVLCWVGERTSLPEAEPHNQPAVERPRTNTLPLGKLAETGTDGQAAEGESGSELDEFDELDESDELGMDAAFISAATPELALGRVLRPFECGHDSVHWRARSSIGARGPPIV